MHRVHNFSAGPAALPLSVLEKMQAELLDWQGRGYSVMEMGHRTPMFREIVDQSERDLRELMHIPKDYSVLFLPGGARVQFAMLPMNLSANYPCIDFIETGFWSQTAIAEAKRYANVNIVASSKQDHYSYIPARDTWQLNPNAAYCYYTANETIEGVEFYDIPDVGDIPLVCDMTSNILARPIEVSRFGVIFAGAQKNAGIAGLTLVIIRNDLLQRQKLPHTPSVFDYALEAEKSSLLITPPTFSWYVTSLVLNWLKEQGGLEAIAKINQQKSDLLYQIIDEYDCYTNPIQKQCRSRSNVVFRLANAELEHQFLQQAEARDLFFLKGHAVSGGIRASLYNAVPLETVQILAEFMREFANTIG
ncbi:MAG: 3-phosphoserine/phosphohydroxythreonine transaminase [Legionellales bacterium]|nr:3-phosphoserine/phosphohydroxythreonine transaminase [Legionellales bacterium]